MTFKEFMQRQAKLMQRMARFHKITQLEWIERYSAIYRCKIVERYGEITPS